MTQKHITRRSFLQAAGAGMAAAWLSAPAGAAAQRPNVIILYTDDQGTLDLNCYGAEDLHTPHLDGLAARGVRFTQFYAASSVCSPSRAALLTGRYPHRAGVPGNTESRPEKFGRDEGLPLDEVTLAELLKEAGYRTAQFGKWHLGAQPGPNAHGFDESCGFLGGCIDKWSHFNYGGVPWGAAPQRHDWYRNGKATWMSGRHCDDIVIDEATDFIARKDARPFFLYLAFGSPHYPMQPHDKWRAHYAHLDEPRRVYAAMVSTIDEQVGRLLGALDDAGLRENTLIVFQSDHGHSTEARNNFGGGYAGAYRGAKASLFEGGLRVPAIISLPGRIPEGEARGQFCTSCDWYPTIAALCGVAPPERALDGASLEAVLDAADAPAPHDTWHWQLGGQWAVRQGDWKLIVNGRDTTNGKDRPKPPSPFLSNLARDPHERTNFAGEHPDVVERLTKLHAAWVRDVGRDG